jgi:hypothetical protein
VESVCFTIGARKEMALTTMIGNGGPNIRSLFFFLGIFSAWGSDKKILWSSVGLQSGLIGTGWSSVALLGRRFTGKA